MMHHAIRQNDKESLQDYYLRTTRSLATQHLFGNKLDADIDQALDFTYKLDRRIFQTMITKNKEYGLAGGSEIRKDQIALRTDSAGIHVSTYPATIAVAFQRAIRIR